MTQPLVTLGLPVYNERSFIEESLENLLKQTYPNLEIIIADNGSTDGTADICRSYAAKHERITYVRHPRNIGQNANFNYLPKTAGGAYFCWASGHDLLDETFVERCIRELESHPDAVLAYPKTIYMTQEGKIAGEKKRNPFDIRSMTASGRFREVMWRVDCNYVYGMWRLAPMLDSRLFRLVPAADRVFLSEMAIKGTFVPADTAKYYRDNRGGQQTEIEKRHRLMRFIFPHKTFTDAQISGNDFYAPTQREFHRTVKDADFSWYTDMRLHLSIWLAGVLKYHLFPGADALSTLSKKLLPKPVLRKLMSKMQ